MNCYCCFFKYYVLLETFFNTKKEYLHTYLHTYTYLLTHLLTYLPTYLPTYPLLGSTPSESLGPLTTETHSFLSAALCHHLLNFLSHRSFSTSSSHLILGLLLLVLHSGLVSSRFLIVLPWSILTTCPINSSLFFLISAALSRSLYSSLNSWLVLIVHIPCSTTSPYIVLHIFLSHVPILFVSISVTDNVSKARVC